MRTSLTHPIRVDFLPPEVFSLPGRIGITFAPGKKDAGAQWKRDLAADLDRLRNYYEARLLVPLIEDHELTLLGIEDLVTRAEQVGLRVHRLPIRDVDIPKSSTDVVDTIRIMLSAVAAGDVVVVHCRGGLGRAGTLASCALVALGHKPVGAVQRVRSVRPGAVETLAKERFVDTFAEAWSSSTVAGHQPG